MSPDESTSPTLLLRVQRHEPQSWERLWELYGPIVYRWCRRWGVSADDAEDLVQDVFRRVAVGIARFDRGAGGTFRGWLWTIAHHVACDFFHRREAQFLATGGTSQQLRLQQLPAPHEPDAAAEADDRQRLLRSLLTAIQGDFQPRTWEIFERCVLRGEDTAAVAAAVGLSPHSVRQARHRVLQRLREEFAALVE